MRFRFPHYRDEAEAIARAGVLQRMAAWWRAFASNAPSIDRHFREGDEFDVTSFMDRHLGGVDKRIMWEFGPALLGAGHRLVITPEWERDLRPMVDVLLARAPTIAGWEFYGYRVPEPLALAEGAVRGRMNRSLEGWRVCVAVSDEGGVDLTFWAHDCAGASDDDARSAANVATESLLGEELLLRWVDAIEVAKMPVPSGMDVPLVDLRATVLATVAGLQAALPDAPICDLAADAALPSAPGPEHVGYVLKLQPTEAPDYPRRRDLFVATTTQLPMWKRAHSGRSFDSMRFSRQGDTFCYVKMDGSEGLDPSGFADKAEIEDALDGALRRERLGCTIGGGTGLRYSYIDLALLDVERAIPVIQKTLRAGKIPSRTWLHFLDRDLACEWVGVSEDSPRPPGMDEGLGEP